MNRLSPDRERYRYNAACQRVIKISVQNTKSASTQRTRYLPGLELRTSITESLHTITLREARVLHWARGKPDELSNNQLRSSYASPTGCNGLEVDCAGQIITREVYYPYGGTAVWSSCNQTVARYKTLRYSGKERDVTGLYYFGYRYYQAWVGRWLSADPAETVDGLNVYQMVRNNPVTFRDPDGRMMEAAAGPSSPHPAVIDYATLNIRGRLADYPYSKQNKKTDRYYRRAEDLERQLVDTLSGEGGTGRLKVMTQGGIEGKNSGLFAYVFREHGVADSYAISFGGTTAGKHASGNTAVRWLKNFRSNVAQSSANIKNLIGKVPEAYQQADEIVSTLYNRVAPQSKMLLTGHSLGAALAVYAGGRNFKQGVQDNMEIVGFSPAMPGEDAIDAIRDSQGYDTTSLAACMKLYSIVGDAIPKIKPRGGGHLVAVTEIQPNRQLDASFIKPVAVHTQALQQISDTAAGAFRMSHPPLQRLVYHRC